VIKGLGWAHEETKEKTPKTQKGKQSTKQKQMLIDIWREKQVILPMLDHISGLF
jgi:hypothetical protein